MISIPTKTQIIGAAVVVMSIAGLAVGVGIGHTTVSALDNPQSGSTGLQGKISSPPPTVGATISLPRDGQSFSELPITVSGICPDKLLVKVFKNNVFGGSVQCSGGSFSMKIDLFSGRNELVARVYDALDQPGPDSGTVVVNFNDSKAVEVNRVTLTSNYAKRGANPGQVLTWPIAVAGGTAPYAISIDWGDGKNDLKSQEFAGNFDIQHTYENPGVYNIVIKATDKNGGIAYLQLVGVGNGALGQDTGTVGSSNNSGTNSNTNSTTTKTRILWQPAAAITPFILLTFWLGRKHELKVLRRRIEEGERPF